MLEKVDEIEKQNQIANGKKLWEKYFFNENVSEGEMGQIHIKKIPRKFLPQKFQPKTQQFFTPILTNPH